MKELFFEQTKPHDCKMKIAKSSACIVYFTEIRWLLPRVDQSIHLKELLLLEQNKSVTGRELIICFLHLSSAPPPTAPSAIWGSTSVPSLPQWVQFAHRGREPQADHSEHTVDFARRIDNDNPPVQHPSPCWRASTPLFCSSGASLKILLL